ncbi:DUF697 domain-containing protein [Mesorhizobium newzealandense]|uniref:DUF697 domain-containing protein n=1 Tax=Mesorhizobium newzealandense TaxID=1300302 RepID=A0ABW4U8C9_9HYPH
MIREAAKRVSLVTAVSPRALVDVAYVVFEAERLIGACRNSMATAGTLGSSSPGAQRAGASGGHRLDRRRRQFRPADRRHGLAARLSAKLGEGVVNGMMTARIGIAAMETHAPCPSAPRSVGLGDFLSALTSFCNQKDVETTPSGK